MIDDWVAASVELGVERAPLHFQPPPPAVQYQYTGGPSRGTLYLNGVTLIVGQFLDASDFDKFVYGPATEVIELSVTFKAIYADNSYDDFYKLIDVWRGSSANYYGTAGNDVLDGGVGDDQIIAYAGADTLIGGKGNDRLAGNVGIDTLRGGIGNDIFVLSAPLSVANRDVIADFLNGYNSNDSFQLENTYFVSLGVKTGPLNPAYFWKGGVAHDANDFIFYNQTTGALYYDSNGNAAGGVTHIASLTSKPNLTAADFFVV